MDVVVTPTEPKGTSWSLKDRLSRQLGTIEQDDEELFQIILDARGALNTVARTHPTLDTAMTAIAKHMQGACTLDSQDWD